MKRISVEECHSRLLHGLIPAVPVMFNASGEIDRAAQERYVEFMSRQPIAGVAVWAHTGRGLRMSREQRLQILENWTGGLKPGKLVIAGVGGAPDSQDASTFAASALGMARDAATNGADAFLVYPPRSFGDAAHRDRLAFEYHHQLAALGIPIILFYLYEAAGGMDYSPDLLRWLLALPEVVGIKLATLDSVMTYQDIANLLAREFPLKLLITGEDRFFGYSLMCGAQAALVGMGSVCTTLQHNMMAAWFAGKPKEFLDLSSKVDQLGRALFVAPMEGYIRRVLWVMVHQGALSRESAHDPWGPELDESEFIQLKETLRALGELHTP
ncbi:MAG TPA: dihydrodipicolinate synthase family protein [Terriglobia bacterium]|nr:dihydrodipicolinate synthase family protein [Terriglobia bacterium]